MNALAFDSASHTYTLDGARLPSVTQILDQLHSYAGIPPEVLARKAEIGDAVHFATELYDRGELDESSLPESVAGYFAGWKLFREETGFEPVAIEARVYHPIYRYAGTLDRAGRFLRLRGVRPSALALLDLKCTYRLLPAVGPQTAAYANAWESCRLSKKEPPIKHRFAVRLKPDGTYELQEYADRSDLSVFLAATTLYHWKTRNKL